MRSLCCILVGGSLGSLIVQGVIVSDMHQWLLASIAFLAFLGYIVALYYESKEIK